MVAVLSRIVVAVVTLYFMVSGSYFTDSTAAYFQRLNNLDMFENSTVTAIGAKNVHDMIEDHFAAELPAGKTEKKAILIGLDGVRVDTFCALDSHQSSGINALLGDGGYAYYTHAGGTNFPYYNIQATDSAPGWTSILTGELWYKTGVLWNGYEKDDNYPTVVKSLIDEKVADKTAIYSSWGSYLTTTLKSEAESTAAAGYHAAYVDAAQYLPEGELDNRYAALDTAVTDLTVSDLQNADCSDFIFALFESTDEAGHSAGFHPSSEPYMNAFALEDELAQQIIEAVKARPTYDREDWLIIITTDHGGFNHAHGYCMAMERYTFIITNKELTKLCF